MKKIITIDGKEYSMKSSAFTQFAYKDMTGRSFLKDMQKVINAVLDENKLMEDLSLLDEMTTLILDAAYVMICEADSSQVGTKEDFYKSIDAVYDDFTWITETIMLACTPISRQLQGDISKIK